MSEYGQWMAFEKGNDHDEIDEHLRAIADGTLARMGLRPVGEIKVWHYEVTEQDQINMLRLEDPSLPDAPLVIHCWRATAEEDVGETDGETDGET